MGHLLARTAKEKALRRKKILSAAKVLFLQKGYRVTMREIAKRAKLSQPALYLYFKNKDELYIETILEGFGTLEEMAAEAVASTKGIEGKIKALFYAFVEHSLKNGEYFRITQHYFAEDFGKSITPALALKIEQEQSRLLKPGVELVQEGIQSGLFRKDLHPNTFMILFWRMGAGILDLAIRDGSADASAGRFGDLFETAITTLLDGSKVQRIQTENGKPRRTKAAGRGKWTAGMIESTEPASGLGRGERKASP